MVLHRAYNRNYLHARMAVRYRKVAVMWCIDFETEAIVGNPTVRPPKPVGVATKRPGFKARYFSWGHPSGNNSTYEQAKAHLAEIITTGSPLLFHNAKFDLAVMDKWFNLRPNDPMLVHDTMFLVFLADPYADTFSLKPSAERLLGLPPDEQDDLRNWILHHVPEATEKNWGAYIAMAPAEIVAPYAKGDVDRTLALYQTFCDKVPWAAYERERRLLPTIMASEKRGVRVDAARLGEDMLALEQALEKCEHTSRKLLKAPGINLDSGMQLAVALEESGLCRELPRTPTGRRSTARAALMGAISNPELRALLVYRGAVSHCLANFGRPWQQLVSEYKGRLHPDWNQVRQARGDEIKGTRTGRLSCGKPNFQNMPNEYTLEIPQGFPALPIMRQYILPDIGMEWLKRDYSQQELRILAHFSEGHLYERYTADPRIDAHTETGALILEHTGLELPRKVIKIIGFSIIYGAGLNKLAEQLGTSYEEASQMRAAYFKALPEIKPLMKSCSDLGNHGQLIQTWGGREYPVEPPRMVQGRMMNFSYKLLNYLIQGSAGDCTKEAICRWEEGDKFGGEFLATVHDEINIQAPKETSISAMRHLRESMEGIEFDVAMLSDGFFGKNWATLEECA